ncbi:MAG: SDR family oxidoreductase [Candidatus Hydrogenedentota bacterium]
MQRVLLTGASSQTGQVLYPLLKNNNYDILGTYITRKTYDDLILMTPYDKKTIKDTINQFKPDIIIHTSALNLVDYCEDNKEEAYLCNTEFTQELMLNTGDAVYFVFLSTDYVFDGESGPYIEESIPRPISVYGKTKFDAENIIVTNRPEDSLIIRTTVLYGNDRYRKNYVLRLIDALRKSKDIKVPYDQVSSPTYTEVLAECILRLIKKKKKGIYNIAGPDILSRSEFAYMIAEIFGLDKRLIVPVKTEELAQRAKRPKKAGLLIDKIKKEIGIEIMDTQHALKELGKEVIPQNV